MKVVLRAFIAAGALAIAALVGTPAASAGGGGACRGMPVTDERTTNVAMTNGCFTPTIVRVETGATVTWQNNDTAPHTITGANASWGSYDEVAPGQGGSQTFDKAGVYPYSCLLHPGMIGAVVVGDSGSARDPAPAAPGTVKGGSLVGSWPEAAIGSAVIAAGAMALWLRVRRARGRAAP